ncbi:MAG: TonB-dependent receptor [Acidobacteria bacterium]|nr:TonB-dependent receptor [Acidobacteriota bacterium]
MFRIALSLILLAGGMFAQTEVGGATLNGTVTDPSGAAVAGAKVTALETRTGFSRTTATGDAGLYSLVRLPVGMYDLTIEMQGFQAVKRPAIELRVGALLTLDVQLQLGATQEVVSVTSEVPVIETSRSQTSTSVDEKYVANLPINGRNFLDIALASPAVVRDPRGGDLSFGGQRGTANSLLVDGGDSNNLFFGQSTGRAGVRNPYAFSQDSVQEFQVNTSTYGAESGRAGGGVINVITKSGANDLHGGGFWFYRDKAMNANTFINNSRNIRKPPYHFNQFGGHAGGPIRKDKVFFFFDYDGQRNKTPNVVFLSIAPPSDALSQQAFQEIQKYLVPYTQGLDNNVYLFKVDWNIGSNQRLSVRYNANRFTGVNFENGGPSSAQEHTGNSKVSTNNIAGNYTQVFGGNLVWDARFIYLGDDEPGEANAQTPEVVIQQNNATVLQFGRNNFSPRYTNTKRYQTVQAVSYTRGRHTYKVGGDLNFERIDNYFPGTFSGVYTFTSYANFASRLPFTYVQAFAGPGTDGPLSRPNLSEYAFFAQDSWKLSDRLTLNYGVRYDVFKLAAGTVKNPDPGLAAMGLDTSRINTDSNNLGPRLGFAYRLTKSDKMVLRGGYGTYYARTPAIMSGTTHTNNGIQVLNYELRSNFPTYPNALAAAPNIRGVTPNIYLFAKEYVQPMTHQWSLNLETQVTPRTSVNLGYLGVRGEHLSQTRDINLYPAELLDGRFADGTAVKFYRHPGTAGPARPNPNFGRISLNDSGADSTYHGGFVQINKRYAKHFQVSAAYTFSKVIDTAPDQTSVVVPFDDGKNVQNTLTPRLDRGPGDANVKHRLVFSSVWDIDYAKSLANPAARALLGGYQLAVLSSVQSGRYFSATVSSDPNNNSQTATDRPPYLGRNTIEGPGFATLDARISRVIPLYRERAQLRIIVEAFNLTNRANFSNFNRGQYTFNAGTRVFTPTTNFLIRTGSADPRILQLAARITF